MIYSASRRTDMVAFFPDAIAERVRRSRRLEAIVFWTKDIRNLVLHAELAGIVVRVPSIIQFTVTGLAGTAWEPRVAKLEEQLAALRLLAGRLPKDAIRWRFDPVMPAPDLDSRFGRVKSVLGSVLGRIDEVTISFPDPYRHAVKRSVEAGLEWPRLALGDKRRIAAALAAHFPGVRRPLKLCCEPGLLDVPGVGRASCVSGNLFETLYGLPLGDLEKDSGQRTACGCAKSTDIGSYAMSCPHRCLYCYANRDA